MRPVRRVAVGGSVKWPADPPAWEEEVRSPMLDQLRRMPPDSTLIFRHGDAEYGPDNIAHRLCVELMDLENKDRERPDVIVLEERVPADWEHCGPECKPVKANGDKHRLPNRSGKRGAGEDYCPAAGHRRNPDVVIHPDHPVNLFLAFLVNDSPGTTATIRHAKSGRVPHRTWNAYI